MESIGQMSGGKWNGERIFAKDGEIIPLNEDVGFYHVCCNCDMVHRVRFVKDGDGNWAFVAWQVADAEESKKIRAALEEQTIKENNHDH